MEILGLKKANCKNCYKCIRECPVKSIKFEEHQAHILAYECILCGRCMVACPQNAKIVRNDVQAVKDAIAAGRSVIASVAPSFIVDFEYSGIEAFEKDLQKLGFKAATETAEGAYIVKTEYERLVSEKEQDVIITTCCSSVVNLVQKYYPTAIPYLAQVLSPMLAHADYIKEQEPEAFVVFIGPCISKKEEAEHYPGHTDCVLTFEEVRQWLEDSGIPCPHRADSAGAAKAAREAANGISGSTCPESSQGLAPGHGMAPGQGLAPGNGDGSGYTSRFFPQRGGILKTMKQEHTGYRFLAVDGVENCKLALENIVGGGLKGYFVEMSACMGSCINGPIVRSYKEHMLESEVTLEEYARPVPGFVQDYDIQTGIALKKPIKEEAVRMQRPGEATIKEILRKMGKELPEDELNCGTCGYPTCRDKAIAVYNGKADITMCLPYMKERAESFSDQVIHITPNAIIVLDNQLSIQQMNLSARHLFNLKSGQNLSGSPVVDLMNPSDFLSVLHGGPAITDKKEYLAEYDKYIELSIVYEKQNDLVIGIMKDITQEEKDLEKTKALREKTIDVTDKVIEKQMRIVQEIASLLGETTAETKIALTTLKNTVFEEEQKE